MRAWDALPDAGKAACEVCLALAGDRCVSPWPATIPTAPRPWSACSGTGTGVGDQETMSRASIATAGLMVRKGRSSPSFRSVVTNRSGEEPGRTTRPPLMAR
ncbi:hypothetical protein SAMN05216276_102261 [Streptosporangium subroseum]|uniref:Uncharacterized protein n=1 Tax=Streptosporangium subroseum TaxID=106412 RepID=A0A239JFC8_9ACTN|nr:hypothetical protein SAMN05216276_102261 [Streptosporangium subroseum]